MRILENIRLAPYTTLQVGGSARYFAEPADEGEILEALRWARARSLPVFVLGGGSNLLVSDEGFRGLVLHMVLGGIDVSDCDGMRIYSVGAGVDWDSFVARTVDDNCAGIECLSGIPGTVGGTPVQNVGAYGEDVSQIITRVYAIDPATLGRIDFDRDACEFRYRESRFNRRSTGGDQRSCNPGRYILTRVDYALRPGGAPKIAYADLKRYFSSELGDTETPTLAQTRAAILAIRRGKGMVVADDDPDSRSSGSFFKNPVVSTADYERIAAGSAEPVPNFEARDGMVKLSAGWLIERSGISRGLALGHAAVSGKHILALVNRGGATAADILRLKDLVQRKVRERFDVELHPETVLLGF